MSSPTPPTFAAHGVPQTSELVLRTSIVASTIGVNHRSAGTSSYANSRPCSCSRSSCTAGAIGGTTLAVGRCAASGTTERGVAALALRTATAIGPSMGCRPRGGVTPLQGCQHTHRDATVTGATTARTGVHTHLCPRRAVEASKCVSKRIGQYVRKRIANVKGRIRR